jgi:hypothetical protein
LKLMPTNVEHLEIQDERPGPPDDVTCGLALHRVIAVRPEAMHFASSTHARLRLFKADPHPDAVVAWELCL